MEVAENGGVELPVQSLSLAAEVAAQGVSDTQNTSVLKLKGLPFSAQEADLKEFFAGFQVVKAAVHIGHDGRPSGLGFVEFTSPEEAGRAMTRDRAFMGPRFVKLLRVPKQEMEEQLNGGGYGGGRGNGGYGMDKNRMGMHQPHMGYGMMYGQPYGQMPYPMMGGMDPRGQQNGGVRMGGNMGGLSGQTLKLRGLPFRTTVQEIVTFFDGYESIPETINFGMDRMRRPSGEAWISFRSPEEAERAAANLNKHYIGNRYIELQVV